jgi:glycosyltransferase involved in cell wall biosynthesis
MPKVAIVHYWLLSMRGGEKVLEALCELYPDAHIYTHVYDPAALPPSLTSRSIRTTFIQKLPLARRLYQKYLPLMPLALEELDLSGYDLVISCESGPAKGVITRPDALHICYCHTPMRYLWDQYYLYRRNAGWLTRLLMPLLVHRLRIWDVTSAARVDHFIANSTAVQARIRKFYRRDSVCIAPPCDVDAFAPDAQRGDYYLYVGQLVAYKRVDLAIQAANRLGRPLLIIGEGEERARLEQIAGPTVRFLGKAPFALLKEHYARCRALIFPGEEDFGIVPVEAMASGRPVIAYQRGGALDTVVDGVTGVYFPEQSVESLAAAIGQYERAEAQFDAARIVRHARGFDKQVFLQRMREQIAAWLAAAGRQAGAADQS